MSVTFEAVSQFKGYSNHHFSFLIWPTASKVTGGGGGGGCGHPTPHSFILQKCAVQSRDLFSPEADNIFQWDVPKKSTADKKL